MLWIKFWVVNLSLLFLTVMTIPAQAQTPDPIIISLETSSLELQTGQVYDINLRLDGAQNVWLINAEINYDPTLIYLMGTKSGSPVQQGVLFDFNNSVIIRNAVQNGQLIYTLSMTAPGRPVSGDGVVGTFRIYPVAAGTTQLTFSRVTLSKVTQILDNGTPVRTETEDLAFTPVLLQLTITGDAVPIPAEATATPLPTETAFFAPSELNTLEPTLVNVTLAPQPESTATPAAEADSQSNPVLTIGLVVVVSSGIGLIILAGIWLRSRRKS